MTDFLFGESPSQDITPTTTLTSEQEELLKLIIGQITGGLGEGPNFGIQPGALELQSLAGLEALGTAIPGGEAGTAAAGAGLEALERLFTQGPQDIDKFFTETIEKPALESFRETTIPDIRTRFAPQFFGGERREAEGRATEDLIDALTRERARVGFEARETDQLNLARGLSVLPGAVGSQFGAAGGQTNLLLSLLGAGGTTRQTTQQQLDERNRRMREALSSLGIEGFENIVFNDPGSEGFLLPFLGAAFDPADLSGVFGSGGGTGGGGGGGASSLFATGASLGVF